MNDTEFLFKQVKELRTELESLKVTVEALQARRVKKDSKTGPVWEAYSQAYLIRWRVPPVRNAKVNGILSQFLSRVGEEEAPEIARFYLSHNDRWYVQKHHPVDLMLRDAEGLRTQWVTGRKMTDAEARQTETRDYYSDQLRRLDDND